MFLAESTVLLLFCAILFGAVLMIAFGLRRLWDDQKRLQRSVRYHCSEKTMQTYVDRKLDHYLRDDD